ncbi:hypothetical protein ACLEXA_11045 [Pseudescherichia vulneris]
MYYRHHVIRHLQSNKILALKLDHAVTGVGKAVSEQIDMIGAGAKRALYYASCLTDEYHDVCLQQRTEDLRFKHGVTYLLQHGSVVYDMLTIYFEEVFKYRTSDQLDHIKKMLMEANIHIAASHLTGHGFALAVATSVSLGMNLSIEMSALAGRWASRGIAPLGVYGIVQKAADSASRLRLAYPAYYSALYAQKLEMMYFLIDPIFEQARALKTQWASDSHIVDIITRMIR